MLEWDHLDKAKANYFFHAIVALKFSFLGLAVFVLGIVHAFLPFLFGFTPYRLAKRIVDGTEKNFLACVHSDSNLR